MSKVFTPNGADTAIMIDASLQHNQRVQASIGNIDELIYAGNNILSNLKEQGGFLKSFQRKILDISNMLGLSNTVMRMIERRSSQDKIILFGGMIATSFIMLLLYIYFLRWAHQLISYLEVPFKCLFYFLLFWNMISTFETVSDYASKSCKCYLFLSQLFDFIHLHLFIDEDNCASR